mgnify:CR=1 FL=1
MRVSDVPCTASLIHKRLAWRSNWLICMKQSSLESLFRTKHTFKNVKIVDLCCGAGGFTQGAVQAGHISFSAIDCDAAAIACHAHNHPGCRHTHGSLPDVLPEFPKQGFWHLHASPPCQQVSSAGQYYKSEDALRTREMISWCIELVRDKRPTSWSLEEVVSADVYAVLESYKQAFPDQVDFHRVNTAYYGLPQERTRVLAGSPFLIQRLRRLENRYKIVPVSSVITCPPGWLLHNNCLNVEGSKGPDANITSVLTRSVNKPSYTIMASHPPSWYSQNGERGARLTPKETAAIQTFPKNYHFPENKTLAQHLIGNAVPPVLSEVLLSEYRPPLPPELDDWRPSLGKEFPDWEPSSQTYTRHARESALNPPRKFTQTSLSFVSLEKQE